MNEKTYTWKRKHINENIDERNKRQWKNKWTKQKNRWMKKQINGQKTCELKQTYEQKRYWKWQISEQQQMSEKTNEQKTKHMNEKNTYEQKKKDSEDTDEQ